MKYFGQTTIVLVMLRFVLILRENSFPILFWCQLCLFKLLLLIYTYGVYISVL